MSFLENLRRKGRSRPAVRSTRRRPLIEDLESRVVMSSNVFSGSTGADVILLRRDPNNAAALEVKITQGTTTTTDVSLAVVAGDTITLNGLGGDDTFNVENTFVNVPVTLNGGVNNDTVNISQTARNLDNIDAQVSFDGGGGGTDTLNTYDQNDPLLETYTETSSYVSRTRSQPINYSGIDAVNVYSGTGRVTHEVVSTAAGVTTKIVGNTNDDAFEISRTAMNLGNIAGALTVNGGAGANSLSVYDQNNLAASTYTVTGTTLARSGSNTVTYSSMNGVNIDGGLGSGVAVTYNIVSTLASTPVTIRAGTGNHTFVVSPTARNLDAIAGNLSLTGVLGKSTDTLVVNDQNNTDPSSYILTGLSVSRTNTAKISFGPAGKMTVNAGSNNNTVSVVSTPTSGSVYVYAGGGSDTLALPNVVNTIDVSGNNSGSLGPLHFYDAENLTGGSQDDTFQFEAAGSISGKVSGGPGGINTLDFSKKTASVTVNLLNGTSTYTGGVLRIQNVTGGSGADVLIGDGQANNLQGNGGGDILVGNDGTDTLNGGGDRDLLIGGLGSDTLDGRGEDDLEIGGTTSYDANVAALQAIEAEWVSAIAYPRRINDLRTGAGLSGGNYLQATGATRTVFDDGSTDTLTGGQGQDWFFQSTGDTITDLGTGGTETLN